ncbi:hypothetical protein BOX15_Mlig010260g1 [Macrostomum lignano]|uniref:Cyclin-dependent kinases regulatory subunit n=1 Tax=Macrostomum lignano TaxID=282301 RepID=A0A267E4C4_9PLAT|nr:hypothetical protein BOX15_Mlig010260g2 [Macrostomum lignano]PAA71890.1 hypothetical protein BOX15_Mlig005415g1 [Macrostomum lignano]PAA90641.1 hypothetical protein BOX15_Mlig010260g1 [Macrostomum lignano]
MSNLASKILYSEKYRDDMYEYRHCHIPKELVSRLPRSGDSIRLMSEAEWRSLGIQQSLGWVNYMVHHPEPHIILFRRPIAVAEEQARAQARAQAKAC